MKSIFNKGTHDHILLSLSHNEAKHVIRGLNDLQYTADSTGGDALLFGAMAAQLALATGQEDAIGRGPRDEQDCTGTNSTEPVLETLEVNWS